MPGDSQLFTGSWKAADGTVVAIDAMSPDNTYTPVTEDAVSVTLDTAHVSSASKFMLDGTTEYQVPGIKDYAIDSAITLPQIYAGTTDAWKKTVATVNEMDGTIEGDTLTLKGDASKVTVTYEDADTDAVYVRLQAVSNNVETPEYQVGKDQLVMVTKNHRADASSLADPVKTGATFDGWYTTNTFAAAFDFGTVLAADTSIYAKFTADPATVEITFDLNYDNSEPIVVEATVGGYVDAPANPVRDGCEFRGWFDTAATVGDEFDPSVKVDAASVYYARWESTAVTNVEKLQAQVKAYPFKSDEAGKLDDVAGDFTKDSWIAFKRALNGIDLTASDEDKAGEALEQLLAAEAELVQTDEVLTNVYRSYNPNDGDHVYTWGEEAYALADLGWDAEGAKFSAVAAAKAIPNVSTEVYRVYDPFSGEHLNVSYEEGADLVSAGWRWDDGNTETQELDPMFYEPLNSGDTAMYRVYNPFAINAGRHVYSDEKECSELVGPGYVWDNDGKPVYTFGAADTTASIF